MSIVDELNKIADMLEGLEKTAGVYAIGDVIVCLNPIEPIEKGKRYRVTDFPRPGYTSIEDLQGTEIGVFRSDRFCKDNYEY